MSDDKPLAAYDPDTTPGTEFGEVGQSWNPEPGHPTAPVTAGETFTDEDGNTRHVDPSKDGRPVALTTGQASQED